LENHRRWREIFDPSTMSLFQDLDPLEKLGPASAADVMLGNQAVVVFDGKDHRDVTTAAVNDGRAVGRVTKKLGEPALGFGNAETLRAGRKFACGLCHGHQGLLHDHDDDKTIRSGARHIEAVIGTMWRSLREMPMNSVRPEPLRCKVRDCHGPSARQMFWRRRVLV
jgi:hypothetical protein